MRQMEAPLSAAPGSIREARMWRSDIFLSIWAALYRASRSTVDIYSDQRPASRGTYNEVPE